MAARDPEQAVQLANDVAFGLTAFAQAGIAIGLVVGQVAPAIASERVSP